MPPKEHYFSANMTSCKRTWGLAICVAGFVALFWSQTLSVPYWGDDYSFLLDAHQGNLEGRHWYAPFFPETKVLFWRPLGMETYWRLLETFFAGNVLVAHIVNILLIVAAAAAVGWLVALLVDLLLPDENKLTAAAIAAFLYGIHSAHFLPAAWVSAANDSICVIFSALTLRFWLIVATAKKQRPLVAATLVILCLLLALLSRDIAFVLPPLMFLLALWLWPHYKPSFPAWSVGVLCIGVAFTWLAARNHYTLAPDPAYVMRFGTNVIRNAGCLLLFYFNTPFESLRYFFFVKASFSIAAWGIACFLLQAGAFGILLRGAWKQIGVKGALILCAFTILGSAPYFLLNFNCYPYYTSISLIGYAIVAGLSALRKKALIVAITLALISTTLSTLGNYLFDSPSHIGRARWVENQLVKLTALQKADPRLFSNGLNVLVEDNHKFLGFGQSGLAYRLGLDISKITILYPNDPEALKRTVLVVPKEGDLYFREAR